MTVEDAPFVRNARVTVEQPGIRPWSGIVRTVKRSKRTGWWVEIERDDTNHECYIVAAERVTLA